MGTKTYAMLCVSADSEFAIRAFLMKGCDIRGKFVRKRLHLIVYYAPFRLPMIEEVEEQIEVDVDIAETRFMVMGPGGENPRPELDPAQNMVGIRITRRNTAYSSILSFRRRVYAFERGIRLRNGRHPTDDKKNAFGARNFQPHVSLLRAGSGIQFDLTPYGEAFRKTIPHLRFDRFVVQIKSDFDLRSPKSNERLALGV